MVMDKNGGLQERSPTWRLLKTDRQEGRKVRDELLARELFKLLMGQKLEKRVTNFSRVSYIVQIIHGPKNYSSACRLGLKMFDLVLLNVLKI